MSEFVKLGNKIVNKPNGLDYDLIDGKIYNLKFDGFSGGAYLEEDGSLNLPSKVYLTEDDKTFIHRVNSYFQKTTKLSTGVMLSGIKGTGKTVMAKVIANNSKLPVIVVDEDFPTGRINDFFRKFDHPVAVIFDEVDKHWDTEDLLGWLDGVQTNAKKLVLFTCNNENQVNQYLKDRCSRIRYVRHFEPSDNARFLKEIMRDKGIAESDINSTYDFIVKNFNLLSIDNILAFLDEKLMFGSDLSNTDILKDMNISIKGGSIVKESESESESDDFGSCACIKEYNDDYEIDPLYDTEEYDDFE